MNETPSRPVLRYHGGKFKLAPWIVSHLPAHRVYVEPYAGAASILMQKPRSRCEVINDLDGQIVGLFRVLRDPDQSLQLERLLRLTPYARDEMEAAFEDCEEPVERARRLVVRSFQAFGSTGMLNRNTTGWRRNRSQSTLPASEWASYPESLGLFCARLRGVMVENRPAVDVIAAFDNEDAVFYCDPPYVHQSRGRIHPSNSYRYEMSDEEHVALFNALSRIRGMALVSGYRSELYDDLYSNWQRFDFKSRAKNNEERTECLWLNEAAVRGASQTAMEGLL